MLKKMPRNLGLFFVAMAGFILLIGGREIIAFITDWLFFRETGFEAVFSKTVMAKLLCGLALSLAAFLAIFINLRIAATCKLPLSGLNPFGEILQQLRIVDFSRVSGILSFLVSLGSAIIAFPVGAQLWKQALLFIYAAPAGITDPLFNKDISFFLFQYPFYDALNSLFRILIVLAALLTAAVYAVRGGLVFSGRFFSIDPFVKRHIGVLISLFLATLAIGFFLDRYGIMNSEHGILYGASYTDVHARLIMLSIMAVLTALAAPLVFMLASRRSAVIALFPVIVLIGVYILGLRIYPTLLQNFKVAPNEKELERPFIADHIKFTRYGFGLENMEVQPFAAAKPLTYSDVRRNFSTIRSIRLWDEEPLLKTYSQLQQIRTYYNFNDVDNDRYTINGEYLQVMLSPRELSYADLPGKSWINERLVFTHGFGLAMGPVSGITREGLPEFFVKDIPPLSTAGLKVTRPEIYYGESPNDYVIVNTKTKEFNYPTTTQESVYTTYTGKGGVRLSSIVMRLLYAAHFANFKIVLSTDVTDESRVLYYRRVLPRLQELAPFLSFDGDPYMVVRDDGTLCWIVDAYTQSGGLPYSKPFRGVNYVRNSVKAVIDAYDGNVSFYIVDRNDILAKTYAAVFPTLFRPADEMPQDIRKHIRYPRALLQIQAHIFSTFHMTDPAVFYNKEDLWEIPAYRQKTMEPYYLITRLPGHKAEEFILLLPFTPAKRDNLAAWMAARCDGANYGKVIVYTFPRDRLVFGPRQIDARIDQDSYIAQQLTLWGQRGSDVIRGSLLVIPIEDALLYVQPLYLVATDKGGLPELRRVIAAYGNNVVMEDTLEAAIQRLFSGQMPSARMMEKAVIRQPQELGVQALEQLRKAREALRREDWIGYGKYLKELEETLRDLSK